MRISAQTRYGIKAMIELAKKYNRKPLSIKELARRQNIPERFLVEVMSKLVKANLVKGMKGRNGGFTLARPPHEISYYDIVSALEKELEPVPCINSPENCESYENCQIKNVFRSLYNEFIEELKQTKLT